MYSDFSIRFCQHEVIRLFSFWPGCKTFTEIISSLTAKCKVGNANELIPGFERKTIWHVVGYVSYLTKSHRVYTTT